MDKSFKCYFPIAVSYTNNKREIVNIGKGDQYINSMNTANAQIAGRNSKQPVIFFSFQFGNSYPIGYFRNRLTRDWAFRQIQLITPNRPAFHFNYEKWFEPVKLSQKQLLNAIGKVDIQQIIKHLENDIGPEEFLSRLNSTYPEYLQERPVYSKDDIRALRQGRVLKDIVKTELVVSLSIKFNAPKDVRKIGITNELFWGNFIFNSPPIKKSELI